MPEVNTESLLDALGVNPEEEDIAPLPINKEEVSDNRGVHYSGALGSSFSDCLSDINP